MSNISRRKFLKTGAAALAGITIAPSTILGMSHGHVSPTDKLNLAAVGIGGMGHANINHVKGTENIVALCDVDWKYAKGVFDEFPKAKKYWDYRKMYEEMGKSIDGVIIATADHTHAIITADAMTMGKHVYCQKPLTHSVYESRLLTKLAASTGVVTQMGNQGASDEGTNTYSSTPSSSYFHNTSNSHDQVAHIALLHPHAKQSLLCNNTGVHLLQ